MVNSSVPAGWYPDGSGKSRWWDGNAWTDHIHDPAAPPPGPPRPVPAGYTTPAASGAETGEDEPTIPLAANRPEPSHQPSARSGPQPVYLQPARPTSALGSTPWWKQWWAIGGAGALAGLLVGSVIGAAGAADTSNSVTGTGAVAAAPTATVTATATSEPPRDVRRLH